VTGRETPSSARHSVVALARAARRRRTGRITDDVVLFADLMRSCGALVPGGAPARAVHALNAVRLDRRADVHGAMRAALVTDRPSSRLFDLLFPIFWGPADIIPTTTGPTAHAASSALAEGEQAGIGSPGSAERRTGSRRAPRPTASDHAGDLTPAGPARAEDVDAEVRRMLRALARAPGHRHRAAPTGDGLDLRTSLRHGLQAGELVELRRTRFRPSRAEIAILCDVSSSMTGMTGLFLAVTHALARQARLVEAGIFHVDLTLIGEQLRRLPLSAAVRRLGAESGGTRIGHCLREFLDAVEFRLSARTIAFILSDGWDVGEPELLAAQMRRLRERVGRIVWCDPHAAATGFDPQVRGLCVALPYVDDHLDLSGPAALRGIADHFERPHQPRRTHDRS